MTSCSQFEPGKMTTPKRMRYLLHRLDAVVLDDGVGQQLVAHLLRRSPRSTSPAMLDVLADAYALDALVAEVLQSVLGGRSGRVEDALLVRHVDLVARHAAVPSRSVPTTSSSRPSSRMPQMRLLLAATLVELGRILLAHAPDLGDVDVDRREDARVSGHERQRVDGPREVVLPPPGAEREDERRDEQAQPDPAPAS